MTLTSWDVRSVAFRKALLGYDPGEVDVFLERVVAALDRLHDENAILRSLVATMEGSGPRPQNGAHQGERRPPAAPIRRVLSRPLPGESGEEAALRAVLLAQRAADQVVSEARLEADRQLAAAHADACAVRAQAESRLSDVEGELEKRRAEWSSGLETERQQAEAELEQLRAFEREYRLRLRAHLEAKLREIDGRSFTGGVGRPQRGVSDR